MAATITVAASYATSGGTTIPRGFHVLKRRWVVERTFAWFGRNRRLSRDFERLIQTSEMLLYAAMTRITLRRIANKQQKIA